MPADVDVLRHAQVFGALPDAELRKLSKVARGQRYRAEEVLFRQGDASDALYVITRGRVRIVALDSAGREKVLAFGGPSEVIGEMGVLTGEPRSAAAIASTDCLALRLTKQDFDAVLTANPRVMRDLLEVVARRRTQSQRRVFDEASATRGIPRGHVSVVFSPRGGAGTTTIATNLAVALAQRTPDRVALVDLKLLLGHAALSLNLNPRSSLAAISITSLRQMDRDSFESYLSTHRESTLRVLAGALRPEEAELVTADHVRATFELLRNYFAHVIVDTGRNFSEVTLAAAELADALVLVCTPEPVGVRGARETLRILSDLLHVPRERLTCVLNTVTPRSPLTRAQVEQALDLPMAFEIPFGGDAPTRAALEGYPLVTRWASNAASKAIVELAAYTETRAREALALAAGLR